MATTPEQERNLKLARPGIEAWLAGDVQTVLGTLTDDVEVYVPAELANGGTYHGKDGFLHWVRQWDDAWSEMSYELIDLIPAGERHVVATVRNKGRGRGSGAEVQDVRAWVMEVRDGQAAYFSLQRDADEAFAHAQERER